MTPSGVSVYDDLLRSELESEEATKASLEQRGLAVITTSGALVTLLLGLAALSTEPDPTFALSKFAGSALAIALVLFVGAALCGLLTNWPFKSDQASPSDIEQLLSRDPEPSSDQAQRDNAFARVAELKSGRRSNGHKARLLVVAMLLEVAAVVAVAIAVWDALAPF